jgi:hypothetical protein
MAGTEASEESPQVPLSASAAGMPETDDLSRLVLAILEERLREGVPLVRAKAVELIDDAGKAFIELGDLGTAGEDTPSEHSPHSAGMRIRHPSGETIDLLASRVASLLSMTRNGDTAIELGVFGAGEDVVAEGAYVLLHGKGSRPGVLVRVLNDGQVLLSLPGVSDGAAP